MQIDWLTVAAQIVNFLVLVWLLQRFLYKPVTTAMRRREDRINDRMAEARAARRQAEDEVERLKRRQAELEAQKDEILDTARQEAATLRDRLEAGIREEMDEKRAAWRDHLAEERAALAQSLRRKAGQKVLEISHRVLADYADADLSERVIAKFAERLQTLDPDIHARMSKAAAEPDAVATVSCGAAIDSASKARITRAIHRSLSSDLDVNYRQDPEMVLGVRMTIGEYSVEWSAAHYLDRLQTEMEEIMDAGSRARADAATGHAPKDPGPEPA